MPFVLFRTLCSIGAERAQPGRAGHGSGRQELSNSRKAPPFTGPGHGRTPGNRWATVAGGKARKSQALGQGRIGAAPVGGQQHSNHCQLRHAYRDCSTTNCEGTTTYEGTSIERPPRLADRQKSNDGTHARHQSHRALTQEVALLPDVPLASQTSANPRRSTRSTVTLPLH